MNILFVIDDFFATNNGTSISAQRFTEELRRRGHEVRVLTYAPEQSVYKTIYCVPEWHIPFFDDLIHSYAICLAKPDNGVITRALQWADVAHCMMPFLLGARTKQIADTMGVPTTAAFHIQPENISSAFGLGKIKWINNLIYRLFRRYVYDRYTHVHTPSRFMKDTLKVHRYKADIRAISNGIAADFVYRRANRKRAEWTDKIVITIVGRLSREKRQDVLIDAVAQSRYRDRIQLVLAGKGPLRAQYEAQAERLNLPNRPVFGYYSKEELLDVLAETDLYVHASDMESEAISCIEAFSTGLVPVIAKSDASATPQFAIDGRSLFRPGDSRDLAAHIDYWLDHPEERETMGRRYAAMAEQYRLETSVSQFETMLQDAIATQSAK